MRTDTNRPDGPDERLVRIETRLCKYQEANALQLQQVVKLLCELRDELVDLRIYVGEQEGTHNGE